jgi:cyclase
MGAVADTVSTPVIASSGCGGPEDIYEVFTETDVDAALAASIFHFEEYSIEETKRYLDERGIPVRL